VTSATMSDPSDANQRRHFRHPLTGDLTGRIVAAASGSVIPCMAVDVSRGGMRIVLTLDLAPGYQLLLKMHGLAVPLVVVWCKKEPARKGYFGCGLKSLDEAVDLEALFHRGDAKG
jgi:hypothetical protein